MSFCCTCLVSGFIISEKRPLVHSQSAQKIRQSFSISACKTVNIDIFFFNSLFERIFFTIVMAAIMVYAMIVCIMCSRQRMRAASDI